MSKGDAQFVPKRFAASRSLNADEIALIELYQRQDSMLTQLWQHFLLANVASVGMIVLITMKFSDPSYLVFGIIRTKWALASAIAAIWLAFTYAGLDAIVRAQEVLITIAHQIEGDVGDKTDVFSRASRPIAQIKLFHLVVDFSILLLCLQLLQNS